MTAAELRCVRVALGLHAADLAARLRDTSAEEVLRVEEREVTGRRDRWSERIHHNLRDELERELRTRFARWQDATIQARVPARIAAEAFGHAPVCWPAPVRSTPEATPPRSTPDFGASADW